MARKSNGHVPDTRVVYGVVCTWWGSIHDVKTLRGRPVCPNCLRPLMEVPNKDAFWMVVSYFEKGTHGVARPHPGYTKFMEWMKHRCFSDIMIAAAAYTMMTGVKVDLDERDFADPVAECTCQPGDEEACPFCLDKLTKRQDDLELKERLDG